MTRKLITRHVFPPIPDRRWDWCAFLDGEEDTPFNGWGHTEAEAIEDLRRLQQEAQEYADEEAGR